MAAAAFGGGAVWAADCGAADAGFGAAPVCGAGVAATVMLRPSFEKVAMTGTDVFTVTTAEPLLSLKLADGIALLPNVNMGEAGPTRGSRRKVICSAPASFAIEGFTGAEKWNTSRGGSSLASDAVKCVATLPMNRRSETSCSVTGPPRMRGSRELSAPTGTSPRLFSKRNLLPRSASRPMTWARFAPAVKFASTLL